MRFSVDAHAIGQHLTGNETYIRNLLNGFAAHDDESDFIAYVSRASAMAELPERFLKRLVAENPWKRLGFDLPLHLLADRPALLHVQYTAPLACRVPIVVSVHDVSFLENPEYFTPFRSLQLRYTVRRTVLSAARVLTPSEFSKRAIMRAYGLPDEKITVMPNGVSSAFRPVAREAAARWLESRYRVPPRFILSVGDLQPRKNHAALITAFEQLLRAHPELPQHLVFVGKLAWRSGEILAAAKASPASGRIHFMDFVSDEELTRFYGACDLFVYPSLYEGFGLPIIEAMACGRAVACSNTTAMPEVADSAALLFDPTSIPEQVRAMRDLLLDAELRARMERLGMQRAGIFNWDRTARETLDVYYEVAGAPRHAPVGTSISVL
jgi:glycosyltransferase involved in cell wall biosynthesis